MNVKNLVYALWRHLEGSDIPDDSRYTYPQLRIYIVGAVLESLKANYYEQLNSSEYRYVGDGITTTTTQDVKVDDETGLQYVDVPLQSIKVAGNRMFSITSANPVGVTAVRYVPVREEEVFVATLQPAIPCVVQYYKQDGKAVFFGKKTDEKKVKVNQKYTLPTDDEADLTLPESVPMVMDRALRLLQAQFPADGNNDGVPNNRVV